MNRTETWCLAFVGTLGFIAVYYWTNSGTAAWAFVMGAAFVGECTDAVIRRMEKIDATLKNSR